MNKEQIYITVLMICMIISMFSHVNQIAKDKYNPGTRERSVFMVFEGMIWIVAGFIIFFVMEYLFL